MTGLSSKTILNLIVIVFVILTIYTLKNDVTGFFENYKNKSFVVQTTSPSPEKNIDNNKNYSDCQYPTLEMKSEIERKQGIQAQTYNELSDLKFDLDKPYAPYSFTYKQDVEYYDAKVSEYNIQTQEIEKLIETYNTMQSAWQKCQDIAEG